MTPSSHFISIVLPVYNEGESLQELTRRLMEVLPACSRDFEIIFIDDGSKDNSLKVINELCRSNAKVKGIELSRNYGQTAALAAGIDHARGDIIVTMDADLQHKPEDIPRFLEKLDEGFDIVSGWREVRTDGFMLRRVPSLCANAMMRKLSKMPVRDFASTFKAYRAETVKNIELFGELHRFIPVLADKLGARIAEIGIEVHPRAMGKSNYGIGRIFGVFEDLIFLEFYANYLTKPIRAFGRLFIFFFSIGLAIATTLMLLWAFGYIERVLEHGAALLLAIFLMIIGIQFLVTGILAELLCRIYLRSADRKIYAVRDLIGH